MDTDVDTRQPRLHEHEWQLDSVDFEDARSVSSFRCVGCAGVEFRA